jgi:hypothetical protein
MPSSIPATLAVRSTIATHKQQNRSFDLTSRAVVSASHVSQC